MPNKSIKQILMQRDGMSSPEANQLIADAIEDLNVRLACGETPDDICNEWFDLEPDYIFELL